MDVSKCWRDKVFDLLMELERMKMLYEDSIRAMRVSVESLSASCKEKEKEAVVLKEILEVTRFEVKALKEERLRSREKEEAQAVREVEMKEERERRREEISKLGRAMVIMNDKMEGKPSYL
jgi:hypothetical protein